MIEQNSRVNSPTSWFNKLRFSSNKRISCELQSEASECALACLVMICQWYGHHISLRELRQSMPTGHQGLNLKNIIEYAGELQLSSRAVKVNLEELKDLQLPAILHWQMNHFVVLTKVSKKGIYICDPAIGNRFVSFHEANTSFTGIALELAPMHNFEQKQPNAKLKLLDFAITSKGLKRHLFMLLGLSSVLQIFALAAPFYMQTIVDNVLASNNGSLLNTLSLGFALLLLIETASMWLRDTIALRFSNQFNVLISSSVFAHLLALPIRYFETRHMGDIVSRFGSLQPVQTLLTQGLVSAIIDGLLGVLTLSLMFIYSAKLTFLVCGFLAIYCIIRWFLYYPVKSLNQEVLHSEAKYSSYFMQSVRAIRNIKLSQTLNQTHANWLNKFIHNSNQTIALSQWNIRFNVANKGLFGLENLLVIYIAVGLVQQGNLSVGMLFAFASYKSRFIAASVSLIDKFIEFTLLNVHLHRLEDILFTPIEDASLNRIASRGQKHVYDLLDDQTQQGASIALKDISFTHAGNTQPVFEQLNLHIAKGQFVAVVGASGCGKSTLLHCLLGLNKLSSGQVLINERELNSASRNQFQIAAVMQNDTLLSGSVLDNISNFSEKVDIKKAIDCARLACVHEDIMAMTMQYQTLIGDMGDSLSGGQKQRIIVARALYQNPQLLILDEATSHLDLESEARVCQNLKQLPLTIVMVAHRPQAIRSAQKIYVLSSNGLTESSYSCGNYPPPNVNKEN